MDQLSSLFFPCPFFGMEWSTGQGYETVSFGGFEVIDQGYSRPK